MAILVTGGAGYIGSHVVAELKKIGHEIVVYDSLERGHKESIKNVPLIKGNLLDLGCLNKAFDERKMDAVIHTAGYIVASESIQKPIDYFRNNVVGSLNLLEAMQKHKVNKIVFSSSAAVYGNQKRVPIAENSATSPINPYGESKLAVEKILSFCDRILGMRHVSLRYFNAAGADPGGKTGECHEPESHLIPNVIKASLSGREVSIYGNDYETKDGTCIRDYVHVLDLAHAHILALNYLLKGGESRVYNVGSGDGFSVREIVKLCEKTAGIKIKIKDAPRRRDDQPILVADAAKIRKELGWKPEHGINEIILHAWNWHKGHPDGYRKNSRMKSVR